MILTTESTSHLFIHTGILNGMCSSHKTVLILHFDIPMEKTKPFQHFHKVKPQTLPIVLVNVLYTSYNILIWCIKLPKAIYKPLKCVPESTNKTCRLFRSNT